MCQCGERAEGAIAVPIDADRAGKSWRISVKFDRLADEPNAAHKGFATPVCARATETVSQA